MNDLIDVLIFLIDIFMKLLVDPCAHDKPLTYLKRYSVISKIITHLQEYFVIFTPYL